MSRKLTSFVVLSAVAFVVFAFVRTTNQLRFTKLFLSGQSSSNHDASVTENEAARHTAVSFVTRPRILSRQEWMAKNPIGAMKPQVASHITIHHTASRQKKDVTLMEKMQTLQDFSQQPSRLEHGHLKPAWPDVPYHFYIDVDGQIAEGRDIKFAGDTNTDYDPIGHILIVLEGNFEQEQPTLAQREALDRLTAWLVVDRHISITEIKGHKDYAATACPGKNLETEIPMLRKRIADEIPMSQRG